MHDRQTNAQRQTIARLPSLPLEREKHSRDRCIGHGWSKERFDHASMFQCSYNVHGSPVQEGWMSTRDLVSNGLYSGFSQYSSVAQLSLAVSAK